MNEAVGIESQASLDEAIWYAAIYSINTAKHNFEQTELEGANCQYFYTEDSKILLNILEYKTTRKGTRRSSGPS